MKTATISLTALFILSVVSASFGVEKAGSRYGRLLGSAQLAKKPPATGARSILVQRAVMTESAAPSLGRGVRPRAAVQSDLQRATSSLRAAPDLEVTDIFLTPKCYVAVRIRNNGPGRVPDEVWRIRRPESCAVYLYIDGRSWGGATLWKFDPGRKLQNPGGSTVYVSNLKVEKKAQITAVVDHTKQVREVNEFNNKLVSGLLCRCTPVRPVPPSRVRPRPVNPEPQPAATPQAGGQSNFSQTAHRTHLVPMLPDLEVVAIGLDRDQRVMVKVRNNGPARLPNEVWTFHKPESCAVYLWIDGRQWGGATLWRFDPSRALQSPGGIAVYTSNLKVTSRATITAIVDHTKQLGETDELNNKLARKFDLP